MFLGFYPSVSRPRSILRLWKERETRWQFLSLVIFPHKVLLTQSSSLSLWFLRIQEPSAPTPGEKWIYVSDPALVIAHSASLQNISQEESRTTFLETYRALPSLQPLSQNLCLVTEKTLSPANPTHFSWLKLWNIKDRKPSGCLFFLFCHAVTWGLETGASVSLKGGEWKVGYMNLYLKLLANFLSNIEFNNILLNILITFVVNPDNLCRNLKET